MSKHSYVIPGIWFCETCKCGNLPDAILCRCGTARTPEIIDTGRQISHGVIGPDADKGEKTKRNGGPNKSELEVFGILQGKYPDGLVLLHGLKLFFPDRTSYQPDLTVYIRGAKQPMLIEVKGGYRGPGWEQGYERYRRAKDLYKEYFAWQLWEKKKGEWCVS